MTLRREDLNRKLGEKEREYNPRVLNLYIVLQLLMEKLREALCLPVPLHTGSTNFLLVISTLPYLSLARTQTPVVRAPLFG